MFGRSQPAQNREAGESLMDRAATAKSNGKSGGTANTKVQHSIISRDLTVTGDIITTGDLTVEGGVDGSITCRTLTLGGAPKIKGDVKAETVRVCGAFTGTIAASQVHLVKTAVMRGDILYRTLSIDQGASFEGSAGPLDQTRRGGANGANGANGLNGA
jgi:cytoskeletal protein CcmA (bactofilin family)